MDLFEYSKKRAQEAQKIIQECCEQFLLKDLFRTIWGFWNSGVFHDIDWDRSFLDKTSGKYILLFEDVVTYPTEPLTILEVTEDKMAVSGTMHIEYSYMRLFGQWKSDLNMFYKEDHMKYLNVIELAKEQENEQENSKPEKIWFPRQPGKNKDDEITVTVTSFAMEMDQNPFRSAIVLHNISQFPHQVNLK